MATGGEEGPLQGVDVNQGFSNDSAHKPEDASPRPSGEGTKYLRLLDDDPDPALWAEFSRDILTACRKQQALRQEAEDKSQEIVSLVFAKLSKIKQEGKNPWFYALKVMDLKSREAIRKATKARLTESLTPTGDREHLGGEEGEVLNYLQGSPGSGGTAATIYGPEEKSIEEDEEGFARTFEDCAGPAMTKLPAKKAQLLEDYYSLQNHDREKREKLAENYGLESYNSLQVMIYRTSGDLIQNMEGCMQATPFSLSRLLETKIGRGQIKRYVKKLFRP
jgi:hypothetical protein